MAAVIRHEHAVLLQPFQNRLRVRRKALDVEILPQPQSILKGLKKHGMFVADNGGDWRLSIAPDRRLKGLESLTRLKGSDFEVVDIEKAR